MKKQVDASSYTTRRGTTRAIRMVLDNAGQHESRWSAILSISSKIGCAPQTLNEWVKKAEVDRGERTSVTTEMADKMKALERENRELKQANEILRKASAYFAQAELDRRARTMRAGPDMLGPTGRKMLS